MPVVAQNAPSITIEPPSGLPRSVATVVAGTRCTVTSARDVGVVNVVSFTSTRPPGRSFASTGGQNSSCIAIADHACDTTGGAVDRPVGDDDGAVGVAAAHHAAVEAEEHDLAAFERRGAGEHLRRELHALPADPGDQQLTFHVTSLR